MDHVDTMCIETLEINTKEVYLTATELLLKLLGNILDNPGDEKFRRIRVSNPTIKSKLFNAVGAKQCLIKIGFIEESDFMTLPQYVSINSLIRYRDHIQIRRAVIISQCEESETPVKATAIKPVPNTAAKTVNRMNNGEPSTTFHRDQIPRSSGARIARTINSPAKILRTSNRFLQSVEEHSISVLSYEDPILLARALSCIPLVDLQLQAVKRMREIQKAIKSGAFCGVEPIFDDLVLLELLAWFKESFFTWVDKPACDKCGNPDTKFNENRTVISERVEVYRCGTCSTLTEFHRHCDPSILLVTRRGRCGEWANCFTLMCRAIGFPARHVVDNSDHVWTEVYSEGQKRWLHCDPCENVCDAPLMYEQGWGKHPTYIMAYGYDDIQDVTWRYTTNHTDALKRRTLCSENELRECIELLRNERRKKVSKVRRDYLTRRTLLELVELMTPKTATESDKQGRTSGSLDWRLARGETVTETSRHVWVMDERSIPGVDTHTFVLRYSTARDVYECVDVSGNVLKSVKGWSEGLYECEQVFRKEEKDWKMVYLARRENAKLGKLVWRFEIENDKFTIDEVTARIETDVFENGSISCVLCCGDLCLNIMKDKLTHTYKEIKGKAFDVTVRLTGGKGAHAWQHSQVFRQELNSNLIPFEIRVTLKKKLSKSNE